jgi:hypothetical protein
MIEGEEIFIRAFTAEANRCGHLLVKVALVGVSEIRIGLRVPFASYQHAAVVAEEGGVFGGQKVRHRQVLL